MPRRRRTEKAKPHAEISDATWAFLNDEPIPDGDGETKFDIFMLDNPNGEALRELWDRARGEVLAGWVKDHPGTRPGAWWKCEVPSEPRKQLSGAGCPAWLVLAYAPWHRFGLPMVWAGGEEGDPPIFESQASYLRRHNLLTPHELRVLTAADYERTEVLPEGREVLEGPCYGPNAEGSRFLNEWDATIRARIPAARKGIGFFEELRGL